MSQYSPSLFTILILRAVGILPFSSSPLTYSLIKSKHLKEDYDVSRKRTTAIFYFQSTSDAFLTFFYYFPFYFFSNGRR